MLWYPFIALNGKAVERGFPVSNAGMSRFCSRYCAADGNKTKANYRQSVMCRDMNILENVTLQFV